MTTITAQSGAGLTGVALALALGLLVGLQRGRVQRDEAPGSQFAGVRTYGLLGLAGGISGAFYQWAPVVAAVLLAASAGLVLISYYRTSARADRTSGTGSIAGLLTMACGFLAAAGHPIHGAAIAGSMIILLSLRTRLHALVARISEQDIRAIGTLVMIALVVLPLLPDGAYGPLKAWNPRQLWFVVVLVYGFSLAGYVASKMLGPERGIIATSAAGSMVSSTAVTVSLAEQLKSDTGTGAILHAGISTGSVVMFLRVTVLVAALAPFALRQFALITVPPMLVSLLFTAVQLRSARQAPKVEQAEVEVRNPAALRPALMLVALVMALTVVARWVLEQYGDRELALVLAISGTVDVDSAVITIGSLPSTAISPHTAALVLLAPVALNSLFKAFLAGSIAGWRRALPGIVTLVASAITAALAALLLVVQ
ncbi:MAG: DUF4010 domain-containing protein [Novosphingobium sp.]|nr:DUF4010 domain-containing protein [Novosphingobium sp.]